MATGKANGRRQEEQYKQAAAGQAAATARFAQNAEDLSKEGKEYRTQAADYYKGIAAGGPQAQKALAPQVEATRRQYKIGRESIDAQAPRGGARDRAMRQSQLSEAGDVGRLFSGRIDESMNQLANLGVFGTQSGLQATGGQGQTAYSQVGTGNAFGDRSQQQRSNFMGALKSAGGFAAGLCDKIFKKDITLFHDHAASLKTVLDTPLFTFRYIDNPEKERLGVVLDPAFPIYAEGRQLDIVSTVGILLSAIKSQQKQIQELQKQIWPAVQAVHHTA
jgi:hypothetical protein